MPGLPMVALSGACMLALALLASELRAADGGELAVPDASAVARLVVSSPGPVGTREPVGGDAKPMSQLFGAPERVIKDDKAIGRLLAFLKAHNAGWNRQYLTPAAGQHRVLVVDRKGHGLFLLVIGDNWVEARPHAGGLTDSYWRKLRKKDRERLSEILKLRQNGNGRPAPAPNKP
jgi:hypothetical protein